VRKVVVYELVSLDGVAEDPDQFIADWDDAMEANMVDVIAAQDAVILGRRSYDEWSRYWPRQQDHAFASFINAVEKYVATSTELESEWAHTTVVDTDLVEYVRELKGRPGRDIGVHASLSVATTLLLAGLVDELRLVVAPNVAGQGRRLLDGLPATRFSLAHQATSPSGT
jgi:dihydrofolate reductase